MLSRKAAVCTRPSEPMPRSGGSFVDRIESYRIALPRWSALSAWMSGQPFVLLGLEHAGACVDAGFGDDRFRAHEHWRDDHLVADDKAVDDEVVAVDLPAPRLVLRRLAEDADEVDPLAVLRPAAGDLADGVVEAHDVARGAEAAGAQRVFDQAQGGVALGVSEVFQQHAVAHEEWVDIPPAAPRVGGELQARLLALGGVEGFEKFECGTPNRLGRDAGGRQREQVADDAAVGGDALEGLGDAAISRATHAIKALTHIGRWPSGRHGRPPA